MFGQTSSSAQLLRGRFLQSRVEWVEVSCQHVIRVIDAQLFLYSLAIVLVLRVCVRAPVCLYFTKNMDVHRLVLNNPYFQICWSVACPEAAIIHVVQESIVRQSDSLGTFGLSDFSTRWRSCLRLLCLVHHLNATIYL